MTRTRHAVVVAIRRVVPDLHGGDPAASKEFYGDLLGFKTVMDQGWVVTFSAADDPSVQLTVMREDATAPVNPDVSIEVDDVDAVYAAARQRGCEILHPLTAEAWGVRRFFVRDPNGKVLNILSHT